MFRCFLVICGVLLMKGWVMAAPADSVYVETAMVLHTPSGDLFGTLTVPKSSMAATVTLIIAGSGPTDRNGNNPLMKNESLRKLAYALAENHMASLRFDKRGIGESKAAGKNEADLRFEDYINDARGWIRLLKGDKRFSKVVVLGHSEGSLIGMVASQGLADGFISLAGAGRPADQIIKEQLSRQPQQLRDLSFPIIDSLVMGRTVRQVPLMLFSLFRPSVQPYMISWFHYDPQREVQKLPIPVLVVQGTRDLQVGEEDARRLARAQPHAQVLMIPGMNHVLRMVTDDPAANYATYSHEANPISDELVSGIVAFIRKV